MDIKVRRVGQFNQFVFKQFGITVESRLLDTKESTELALEFIAATQELLSIDHFRTELGGLEDIAYDIQAVLEE